MGAGGLGLVAFISATSLVLLVWVLVGGRQRRVEGRIKGLMDRGRPNAPQAPVAKFTRSMLPKIGSPLLPGDEQGRNRLKSRLLAAGLYNPRALVVFLGVKMLLMMLPVAAGVLAGLSGLLPFMYGLLYGLVAGGFGMIAPSWWLDSRKKRRQAALRRALPDALDMVGVCLKGGLSLQGAFQRVTGELAMAHPLLAAELIINQREMQLGRSTGDAMRHFAERCDLEEIRSLASVILQSERLGASTVQALRVHAETLRLKRMQRAEELAHTAGTKMIFPTILCIFPCILLVIMGPAAIQIAALFASMK
jgi:tight adherence protein C